VGYGKTEVALRAAFKATLDGKASDDAGADHHPGSTALRHLPRAVRGVPVKVEMISRFRSSAEQKHILKEFAAGRVDVLVGTHRLLSQDVAPKDLGLVIVDEEQRFGVAQKEALRKLKVRVDVLTLTATPIPRTLQMSLSGVRDITIIETPPRDRHPSRPTWDSTTRAWWRAPSSGRSSGAARCTTSTTAWRPSTRQPCGCAS